MRGIFQKENAHTARKYGIYRHLPTYEKIIRNLVSFYNKKTQNTKTAAGFTPAAFCSLYKKHRKYIGKRAGKGSNVRESVIDKIQTFFFCFVRS